MNTTKLKNWFLPVMGVILIILDFGFDALNPLLSAIGVTDKWMSILKALFGLYGVYKISTNKPIGKKENS